jgi:hypothetical protein
MMIMITSHDHGGRAAARPGPGAVNLNFKWTSSCLGPASSGWHAMTRMVPVTWHIWNPDTLDETLRKCWYQYIPSMYWYMSVQKHRNSMYSVRVQDFSTGMYQVCTFQNLFVKVCTSMYLLGTRQFFVVWWSHPVIKCYKIPFIST